MDIRLVVGGIDLELPPDFVIERDQETSLFNRELDKVDFTYPASIPLTESNNLTLGLISELAVSIKNKEYQADLYYNGVYDSQVTLRVLNVSTITQTIEISLLGIYGTFARIFGSKKLVDLVLDGDRTIGTVSGTPMTVGVLHYEYTWPDGTPGDGSFIELTTLYYPCTTPDHMKFVMQGSLVTDYHFYPAFDNKANIDKLNDGGSNLINFFDWETNVFSDPIIEYYRAEMLSKLDQRLFWVPFFKTLYVLRKCFEEFGFNVSGDIFTDTAKQKSTLYNTSTICNYGLTQTEWDIEEVGDLFGSYKTVTITNNSTRIHPQDHMPDMTILEFVNEIAKAWNLQYRIDLKLHTVTIVEFKKFKNNATVIDFTAKAFPVFELSFEDNDMTDGYKFEFSPDPAETYLSGKQIDELGDFPVVATVNKLADLTGSFSVNDLAYIRRENAYYQFGGVDWFYYSYNGFTVQSISLAENPVEIKTKAIPLVNDDIQLYRTTYDTGAPDDVATGYKKLFLPCSTIGIKGLNLITMMRPYGGIEVLTFTLIGLVNFPTLSIQPILVNYHGLQPNADLPIYPYACSHNCNTLGVSLLGSNHFWDNPDHNGLFYTQWKGWSDNLINAIPVKYNIMFTGALEDFYDYESVILYIKGQQYVIKKTTRPLPYPSVSNFELIRI